MDHFKGFDKENVNSSEISLFQSNYNTSETNLCRPILEYKKLSFLKVLSVSYLRNKQRFNFHSYLGQHV